MSAQDLSILLSCVLYVSLNMVTNPRKKTSCKSCNTNLLPNTKEKNNALFCGIQIHKYLHCKLKKTLLHSLGEKARLHSLVFKAMKSQGVRIITNFLNSKIHKTILCGIQIHKTMSGNIKSLLQLLAENSRPCTVAFKSTKT